jgi:hypothetical protein
MSSRPQVVERKMELKEHEPFRREYFIGMTKHPDIERMMFDEFVRFCIHCGHFSAEKVSKNFEAMLTGDKL